MDFPASFSSSAELFLWHRRLWRAAQACSSAGRADGDCSVLFPWIAGTEWISRRVSHLPRNFSSGIDDFGGLRKPAPVLAGLMGIALFSSLGLPGLNGFPGEFLIFRGTFPLASTTLAGCASLLQCWPG